MSENHENEADNYYHKETENSQMIDQLPITKQFNLWLGRRHRAYYFVSGFVLASVLSWYIFLPAVLDQTRKSYDRIY